MTLIITVKIGVKCALAMLIWYLIGKLSLFKINLVPSCDVFDAPANGAITSSATVFVNLDTQTITCDLGFIPSGTTMATCTDTGHGSSADWSPSNITSTTCGKVFDAYYNSSSHECTKDVSYPSQTIKSWRLQYIHLWYFYKSKASNRLICSYSDIVTTQHISLL